MRGHLTDSVLEATEDSVLRKKVKWTQALKQRLFGQQPSPATRRRSNVHEVHNPIVKDY